MSYKVVELVFDYGPSDAIEKLLLVATAENADDAGYSWPGLEKLAHRSCRTRRHVIRLIKDLEVHGWITSYPIAEGFGKKRNANGSQGGRGHGSLQPTDFALDSYRRIFTAFAGFTRTDR
jgi:hypothetical protein